MNKILKEPLVHFLLIGAILFFVYEKMNANVVVEDEKQIVVTKKIIQKINQRFIDMTGEEPNTKEKEELLQNYLEQEVLYREALEKGLDKNDKTIRKHLINKIKYVLDDLNIIPEPTAAQLEKFSKNAKVSFNQVLFTYNKDKDVEKSALEFLKKLQNKDSSKVANVGSRIEMSQKDLQKLLGSEFTKKILNAKIGTWQGPYVSKTGLHLIYIHSRSDKKALQAYMKEKRAEANKKFYKKLQEKYTIVINGKNTK